MENFKGENLNTPDYWDKAFEEEYELLKTGEFIGLGNGYRWDGVRFTIISNVIQVRGKLLDIGCGLGNFCRYMKARNPDLEISGIDFSPKAVELARIIEPSIDYTTADAYDLPFPDNSFDIITAQEIIEHLENPKRAVKEWKRVLKKYGKLYITTPWNDVGKHRFGQEYEGLSSHEHLFEWTPKEFAKFCSKRFNKVKMIFPPAVTDVGTQKTQMFPWILAICQK